MLEHLSYMRSRLFCLTEEKNCMKFREKNLQNTCTWVHVQENQPRNSTSTSGKNLRSWPVFSFAYFSWPAQTDGIIFYGHLAHIHGWNKRQHTWDGKEKKKSHTNIAHIRAPPFFGFSLTRERHLTVWPPASLHNTQAYPCKQYKPTMRTALHVCVQWQLHIERRWSF